MSRHDDDDQGPQLVHLATLRARLTEAEGEE